MKHPSLRTLFVNTLGTFGYLTCVLLWAWVAVVFLPLLLDNEVISLVLFPASPETAAPTPLPQELSPVTMVIAVIVTVAVLAATVAVLLRAPLTVARAGKTVTTKAAGSALPLVTRKHALPVQEKRMLTARLIKLMKLLLAVVPVVVCFLGLFIQLPLPFSTVVLIASVLAIKAIFWFSAQYIGARALGVALEKLV